MPGRADTRGTVDVETQVDATLDSRLARVQTHAHAHRAPFRPGMRRQEPLRRDCRHHPILRPLKNSEQLISPRVDLIAARVRHRLAEHTPLLPQDGTVVVPERVDERRRPFDVREEHRHGPSRRLGHTNRPSLEPFVTSGTPRPASAEPRAEIEPSAGRCFLRDLSRTVAADLCQRLDRNLPAADCVGADVDERPGRAVVEDGKAGQDRMACGSLPVISAEAHSFESIATL